MRKIGRVGMLALVLARCADGETDHALRKLDDARLELASSARRVHGEAAAHAVSLARHALLEAERAVRSGSGSGLGLGLGGAPHWESSLARALDGVAIALWVVERDALAAREEAETRIRSAESALGRARQSTPSGLQLSVAARLREAELAVAEARRLAVAERFEPASRRARQAIALLDELPEQAHRTLARLESPTNWMRWRRWVDEALAESRVSGRPALVVYKRSQVAVLWERSRPIRRVAVELGYNGWDRKLRAGDGATPEGLYRVVRKKRGGETRYYKALLLNYPNHEDVRRFEEARASGELDHHERIGGLIEIHGEGGRGTNWTDGCVAVTNREMDGLFEKLAVGSAVAIVGDDGYRR